MDRRCNNIVFFPKYSSKGPSSRYRIYNYLHYYRQAGFNIKVYPLFGDWYLNNIWGHKKKILIIHRILFSYIRRFFLLLTLSNKYIIHVEAELFPYVPSFVEKIVLRHRKYILEYDDAIFHNYDKNDNPIVKRLLHNKIPNLMRKASYIIAGCEYIKNFAFDFNQNVTIIPTAIDADKYKNCLSKYSDKFIIGWVGSSSTSCFLFDIVPALKMFAEKYDFTLKLIGFDKYEERNLSGLPYEIIKWDANTEIQEMCNINVGIMPLRDTPFNQGKCAFKLVQYMSVGLPTISTPLLSNINIDAGIGNLFANTTNEWYDTFVRVYSDMEKYRKIGELNKQYAMSHYTIQSCFPMYIEIYNKLCAL